MKLAALLCLLAVSVVSNATRNCEDVISEVNDRVLEDRSMIGSHSCRAKMRKFNDHRPSVEKLMLKHIKQSYDLLLISSHFARDTQERQGFAKYFEELSDNAWEEAIHLTKYINKRGSHLTVISEEGVQIPVTADYNIEELASLGRALDLEHELTDQVLDIHKNSQNMLFSDPDLSEKMEDLLSDKISRTRELAGYVTSLNAMYNSDQKPLALFHFDNMLRK